MRDLAAWEWSTRIEAVTSRFKFPTLVSIMKKISPLTVALLALGLFMTYVEVTEGKCWEF